MHFLIVLIANVSSSFPSVAIKDLKKRVWKILVFKPSLHPCSFLAASAWSVFPTSSNEPWAPNNACWPQIPNYGFQLKMKTTFGTEISTPGVSLLKFLQAKDGERERWSLDRLTWKRSYVEENFVQRKSSWLLYFLKLMADCDGCATLWRD